MWSEPLARGVDLGSDEAAAVQQQILASKSSLRYFYEETYRKMVDARQRLLVHTGRRELELGSGGGFFRDLVPHVVTSDVKKAPGIDQEVDARDLPFGDESVDAVYAMHVMHHVPDVDAFLTELVRVVPVGGGAVLVEPYWSPLARLLYRRFHPEPWDPQAPDWTFVSDGPLSSNQALSYLMLRRDRHLLAERHPDLEVLELGPFGGPSYVLSGGIWKRPLLPHAWLRAMWDAESRTQAWRRWFALHHLFVLRRWA